MIKGVNKQIIEVSQTGSRYFERALLFVRAEYTQTDHQKLKDEANRLIAEFGSPPRLNKSLTRPELMRNKNRKKRMHILRTVIISFLCAALIFVCYLIFRNV